MTLQQKIEALKSPFNDSYVAKSDVLEIVNQHLDSQKQAEVSDKETCLSGVTTNTDKSREAFEAWFEKTHGYRSCIAPTDAAEKERKTWRASEARILALLESDAQTEEFLAKVGTAACEAYNLAYKNYEDVWESVAKAAIAAIVKEIRE